MRGCYCLVLRAAYDCVDVTPSHGSGPARIITPLHTLVMLLFAIAILF